MKKNGFTLAEVLIAVGLVAVVAAITSPMISSIVPDKKKVQVLKVAKTVSEINNELLNSPVFYYRPSNSNSNCEGLDCTALPLASEWNNNLYNGNSKYMALLAAHMDTTSRNINAGASTGSFTSSDGVVWTFTAPRVFNVDIDPRGRNCSAGANCNNPDRFIFQVDKFGKVRGGDALTRVYLSNPNKLNDRKADYRAAGLIN